MGKEEKPKYKITFADLAVIQLKKYKRMSFGVILLKLIWGIAIVAGPNYLATKHIFPQLYNCLVPDVDMNGNLVKMNLQYYLPESD